MGQGNNNENIESTIVGHFYCCCVVHPHFTRFKLCCNALKKTLRNCNEGTSGIYQFHKQFHVNISKLLLLTGDNVKTTPCSLN